ncbi:helix-turn-helix domain-containing protein [Streptosporangiaceae bacterium NEAU-GS5]|nr:helix-turn-helix domain-containing protein [Streptosporangiaceae bacterium NEAU-GS5]
MTTAHPGRDGDPLRKLGLSPAQMAVYTTVLRLHRATLTEIASAMDLRPAEVLGPVDALIRIGAVDNQSGCYLARHPAAAIGRLVAQRLDKLAEESRQIDEVLTAVGGLTHHYDAGRDYQTARFPIELVSGADELYESVVGLAVHAPPADLVSAIPDTRTWSDFIRKYADPWIQAMEEGLLIVRVVLPVAALDVPGFSDIATRFGAAGGQIRTLDTVPSWFFALGDDAAGMPAEWGGSLAEAAYNCYLVRAPIVVASLRTLFDELWGRAVPITSRPGSVQVLRLASQGMSDESIARHLGISVRTVRARFADAMVELGAQSRFQAGAAAARRGWL